ncbi:MAG TPA: CDP-alcohol phosphatidyltransferase family protein [Ignavibacteriaceae bacterium]
MSLFHEYKSSLKKIEVEELFDLYFYRPLAFLLVKAVYSTNITPNQLTVISMIFGVLGGICYSFGTHKAFMFGAVLYLLYNVVDCSDGQLARLKKNGTTIGRILDGVADYVVSVALYFGIGFGYANNSSNPFLIWLLTAATGISNAIQSGLLDYYRTRYLDYVLNRVSILDDGLKVFEDEFERLKKIKGRYFDKVIIWIYLQYSAIQQKVTNPKPEQEKIKAHISAEEYSKKNRLLIRLWTLLGPTTQWTFLIITSFLNRIDIYLLGIFVVGNILAIIIYFFQSKSDKALKLKS